MTDIIQHRHMTYTQVSETMFLGGTTLVQRTTDGFKTHSGAFTVIFTGTDLTYDDDGKLTGGTILGYEVKEELTHSTVVDITVSDAFDPANLISPTDLAHAFDLYDLGQHLSAFNSVMAHWEMPLQQTTYATDKLHGYAGADLLVAPQGGIRIDGRDGNDTIDSGSLDGATGSLIYGGTGDDLFGPGLNDTVYGGSGNDRIMTGSHSFDSTDEFYGGSGNDVIQSANAGARVYGGVGDDILGGMLCYGGTGADLIKGYGGNDALFGGSEADKLRGHGGDDTLYGGADADKLQGGRGTNVLGGGTGADWFHFAPLAAAHDTITDFAIGEDMIWLKKFHFADLAAAEAVMTDTDAGTLFDFGHGQTLLVEDVTVAQLLPDLTL